LFFNTPKRLFAGDSVRFAFSHVSSLIPYNRNTNLAQLETNHIIDEFVSATGLTKNGGLIKVIILFLPLYLCVGCTKAR
jgi:hypothetical protein